MQISLKAPLLKEIITNPENKFFDNYNDIRSYNYEKLRDYDIDSEKGVDKDVSFSFELPNFKDSELKKMIEVLTKHKAAAKTIDTVKRWLESINDPLNAEVSSLQGFFKVFNILAKTLPNGWMFIKRDDGEMCPILIKEYKHYNRTRDDSEYFNIEYIYGLFSPEKSDSVKGYCIQKNNINWYKSQLLSDSEEIDIEEVYFNNSEEADSHEDIDDEDEDEKPKKKKSKKVKKESVKLIELLARYNLYIPNKELIANYQKQLKLLYKTYNLNGKQYTVKGNAFTVDSSYTWRDNLSMSLTPMQEDGVRNKVVIDNILPINDIKINSDTANLGSKPLPYQPYVRVYDITKYRPIMVHVDLLEEYVYSETIINDIILPNNHKKLLNSLISGEVNFQDIVQGKSGGIIILASGIAGTGKTLTAEVYSEVVKKPLYQIQSHQLGLTPKDIEENLRLILRRADKWNAVLLIDECDTYVYKRGTDMVQNCVVGVFLRLFEYYNGILFLTTNKHDIIDDAIKSRLTAHIRYSVFTKEIQINIFLLLALRFGIEVSKTEATIIIEKYPQITGRDTRNLLKLIKKYYHKNNSKSIKLTLNMIEPIEEFIPFIN